jgi:3-hydroxyacyl-[acyl-carrier-protein] dehydratase
VKFCLLDKIEHLDETRIVASKSVTLAEEYLGDHFPSFPVLPGVMMLEALTQAAGWVLHRRHDFARSMAVLKDARNVRYGQFVAPGDTLRVEVELAKEAGDVVSFKATGTVNGESALSGRLDLAYFNLADRNPALASIDESLRRHHRDRLAVLRAHAVQLT